MEIFSWTTCLISSQKISKDRQYITAINSVYRLTYIPFQNLLIKLLFLFSHFSYLLYSLTYLYKWHCAERSYNFRYQTILENKAQILKISMKIVFATSFHYFLPSNTLIICFFLMSPWKCHTPFILGMFYNIVSISYNISS